MWVALADKEFPSPISNDQFYSGLDVWLSRPHILNRKLLAAEELENQNFHFPERYCYSLLNNRFRHLIRGFGNECYEYLLLKAQVLSSTKRDEIETDFQEFPLSVLRRKLIPRCSAKFGDLIELVIIDRIEKSIAFWPSDDVAENKISPVFPYVFSLSNNVLSLKLYEGKLADTSSEKASKVWLSTEVFPKVFKWCCNSPSVSVIPSLSLVSIKEYSGNYKRLKAKYGKKYVQSWTENSDPSKYVYEDIAIAAYLVTMWENEMIEANLKSKQSFVDLGCGNGLLVDLLTSEGYSGVGIDVRKRKIWDLYDSKTKLVEKAIEPSDYHIFPGFDWLIGNHSDELTPWIPVIAARSSYNMKVFLLPCCFYTFDGKYERLHSDKTQYQSYLSFVQSVCESMGFNVKKDKLRIPSTKRICLVCDSRSYKEKDEEKIDSLRKEFIKNSTKRDLTENSMSPNAKRAKENEESEAQSNTKWISNFKPRDSVEIVQNCSHLDKDFLFETIQHVAGILLKTENFISLQRGSETLQWNSGGCIQLNNLIKEVEPLILKKMKNQCGGFQTFLRNHRNVFTITNGIIQLTIPSKDFSASILHGKRKHSQRKAYFFKEKPCFFFFHHPQGCPLDDIDCSFSHKV